MGNLVEKIRGILKNKKVKVLSIAIILLLLIAIVGSFIFKEEHFTKKQKVNSAEFARAMTYAQVQEGDNAVEGTDNVKFDAFFLRDLDADGYAESLRGTCKEIGTSDTLYMEINVQTEGYLKDAKITIDGKNFYLQTTLPKDQELKQNYIGNNIKEIEFNNLSNGTQKLLTGVVRSGDYTYTSGKISAIGNNTNNYSKVNSVTLTGTYVDEAGNETPITKQVDFNIDWYGKTSTRIYTTNQNGNISNAVNEEEGIVNLGFTVYTEETANALILKKNHVEGTIPQLNGFDPIEVTYTGTNATFNYNNETRTFSVEREAVTEDDGKITTSLSRTNSYGIRVIYPLEAYQSLGTEAVQLRVPVSTYYEGYNNQNAEFTNPYKSNVSRSTILAYYSIPNNTRDTSFEIKVGRYVYEPSYRYVVSKQKPLRIYNGESEKEENDTYTVMWKGFVGTNASTAGMIMQEETGVTDVFIKTNSENESADDVVQNVGIYFSGAGQMLGDEGWIKIYNNETDELIETFTKDTWDKYTSSNPYKYELPVKHIRIETSEIVKKEVNFYAYNIKEIDDEKITTKYEREQFDELQYIKSTLTGSIVGDGAATTRHTANYEAPVSVATISISKNTISTQETEKNDKITITTKTSASNNQTEWQNGIFLVKVPTEIIDVQLNEVTINNSSVTIESYEVIEENGQRFIKIVTKNNTPQTFTIILDVDLSPDPRIATTTRQIELYATNENGSDYYYKAEDVYDVNNNLNKTEFVNHTSASISMVSPNSLLTNQVATNYDDKESVVISPQVADIRPQYAVVDQEQEEQTATIGTQIKNNYASTISDIKILGKIPFEGNTYVISKANLNSSFTTKMTEQGIVVPEELQAVATIYYSENENPTTNLTNTENNWKQAEEVENWDNIKTFLIDLGDYVMPTGKDFVFNYTVKVPDGVKFNQVAYSHHGVYFSLDTENGKYKTRTEPNKLGFRIAEKYDLELNKYQIGKEKIVPGATYSFREITTNEEGLEIAGEAKTGVTNLEGILRLTNLYAERTYEIKEIKSPDEYELNEDTIRFISHVNKTTGELTVEKISGTTKDEITVTKNEGENYKLIVNVEDEAKANLKITKVEQGTDVRVSRVRYKLTGYGFPENGRTVTTNINGEINLKGLKINEEYTLEEVKADGYYLASPIKFKVVNTDGTYTIEIIDGTVKESLITEEDSIPTVNMTLEDEKIPTYDLELVKIQKKTNVNMTETEGKTSDNTEETVYLAGAKFKLYKGTKELGEFITDENGKITIPNLYQYVEEKAEQEKAQYVLKEVLAPEGYAKVKDINFKVEAKDGTLQFVEELVEGQTAKQYTVEGNKVIVTVEDNPSFKLIKKDAETGELLSNVKFAIYNVDNGEVPARNSKGEIIGTKETINGREYYTVSTDTNGEITADLQEGLYKAVEVETPDKYDINKSEYYFGIGASREGKTTIEAEWARGISGNGGNDSEQINSVAETSDGGYIVGGHFSDKTLDLGNGVILNNKGYSDGMIIKYDKEGKAEWAKEIAGNGDYHDVINSVAGTSDGGCIVGGECNSRNINLGNGIVINGSGGIIIKYNSIGEVEWAKGIGKTIETVKETNDEGYIIGGEFTSSSINLGSGVVLNNHGNADGMLIKYTVEGEVEWAKGIGGSNNDFITSTTETSDGGCLVGGYFCTSTIDLENGIILNNNSPQNGIIIKYDPSREVEWAKGIGGSGRDFITSVTETSDGGCLVGGHFYSSEIDLGNGVVLKNNGSTSYPDGMIIKYNSSGEVEWAKGIGGSSNDYIYSVMETRAGGYIVAGEFWKTINLGNGVVLNNHGNADGMLIKYTVEGEAEWAKGIGGSRGDGIKSVIETSDSGIVAGGYFYSDTIDLENGVVLNNKGSYDGMIIKFNKVQVPEVVVKQAKEIGGDKEDKITSVAKTSDGGYIVGGYFKSNSIYVDKKIQLNNKGSSAGIIIKYNTYGEVEWANKVSGGRTDKINYVIETRDGGYIAVGTFDSGSIDLGNGVGLEGRYTWNVGMIIKYNKSGEAEWAKEVSRNGGIKEITSVAETSDGGYVIGGYFDRNIDLGNGIVLDHKSSSSTYDGMIIKYDENGKIEWAKGIGGNGHEYVYSVTETNSGEIIVGGHFYSSDINLGNGLVLNNSYGAGMIIKYSKEGEVEWAKEIGKIIYSISKTSDGGYIVGGYFQGILDLGDGIKLSSGNYDGVIIKYDREGKVNWAKKVGEKGTEYIYSVAETNDSGIIAVGYFSSNSINLGNEVVLNGRNRGMIIKYDENGICKWAKAIEGSINTITEISDGNYIVGGSFSSGSIDLGNGIVLNNKGSSDGMIIKIAEEMGVPDVEELVVENKRKEFKITTDVNEIDNIKGGNISGEDWTPYEKVKYGDNGTKEIVMTPDENYEIIGITINGEEYPFEVNEDGSYSMPLFENITEDKHIEVTYSYKENKITINKIDSITKEKLTGAKFKLDQLEERANPENVIGELTANGQIYDTVDTENQETIDGTLTANGKETVMADKSNEIIDSLGELTNNGTYYFIEKDGKYVPTNSKTYQVDNGGTAGIQLSTANSYIPIDLTGKEGKYVVTINAEVISQSSNDYGYATITETTTAPTYSTSTGRFIYISGTQASSNYTSKVLDGGKIYYLHLGYRKSASTDTGDDQIVINSINVYGTTTTSYNFVESDGKYIPNNLNEVNTTANSYIPIDLTDKEGRYAIVVNAETNYTGGSGYLYATLNESLVAPTYSTSTGRFMYITSTSTAKDYVTYVDGGKQYYLHLGYTHNSGTPTNVSINDVSLYKDKQVTYNFVENEGKYESNNQGQDNRTANSYIPIDLTGYVGKYNLTVNAEIESQSGGDYGYATVTENTTRPSYSSSTGRFIYISGTQEAKDYNTVLDGGKVYYLHLGYYKNASTSFGDDKFTINSVNVTTNDSELYHTEVETNSDGQAITQIPFGKYELTEIETPEGYWTLEEPIIIEFRADGVHEFDIENERKAKVTVHHYIKGTTTKLAEDEMLEGRPKEEYKTLPKVDLEKYELEKDENGEYIIPTNAMGTYTAEDIEVTYYYVLKEIPLTVKHYIEGTETSVPLEDGSLAENEVYTGQEGEEYQTSSKEGIDWKYELVEEPENKTGTYEYSEVTVTYYYKLKNYDITTEVIGHEEINESGEKITVKGGTISGEGQEPYENVIVDETSTKDIIVEADENYKIKSIKVQKINEDGTITEEEITLDENTKTYTLDKFNNVITDVKVIAEFEKLQGTVTVHHYIENTTDKVPLKDGTEAQDENYTGYVGNMYATKAKEDITDKYRLVAEPTNASGNYIEGNIEVIYYYRAIPAQVTVHHYIEGTTTKLAEDEVINGFVTEGYTTRAADVDNKYELVAIPANSEGKMTEDEIIVTYYYKLKDTSVLVHYYKEGTTESISDDVTINGKVDDTYTTEEADDIPDYYELVEEPENKNGIMIVEQTVVTYYYKLKEYSYVVNYLEKDTNEVLHEQKQGGSYEYGTTIDANTEKIDIDGYIFDSFNEEILTITNGENVINIYYTKRTDLSYKVNYLEKDTNKVLKTQKDQDGMKFAEIITSSNEIIDIDGYTYDSVDKPFLVITTGENILNIYYVKRNDLSYKVNYLEKDTNKVLSTQKVVDNVTFEDVITSSNEVIEIDGYNYDSVDRETLTITTGENIINIYYTKRNDLSYKVNYLEKDTNKVLNPQKVVDNVTFEDVITSSDEVIEIDGYNYDSVDKDNLTITTGENIINIYYTKRNDLSYKVNYLEKDIDKVLSTPKVVNNVTFEDVITSSDEIIEIDGYNYDSVDKDTLTITTGNNVINIYYVKRNDLSYKVNYLEKDTDKVLSTQKVVDNVTFEDVITSSDEVIEIDGYNYDSVDKDNLTITTGENIINIYYTKRNDLSYKVNYLEKDTDKILSTQKVVDNVTFEDVITSSDEVIKIDGYNYDSVDKDELVITTEENVINIYYTKRNDLSYKVNYLEKDTDKVLSEQKVVDNVTFEDVITSSNEVITIDGYDYDSVDKDELVITTSENIINIYYTKRADLSYTVNYLEKDTNKVLKDQKVVDNVTFEDVIKASDEVVDIYGYNFDSTDKDILTIQVNDNVINLYYTKKDASVIVHHYKEGTTEKVANDVTVTGKVGDDYETVIAEDLPSKYELAQAPANATGTMTEDTIEVIYYYKLKSTKVIVHHYEEGTTNKLSEDVEIEGLIDSSYTTEVATDIPIKYTLSQTPANATGIMTEEVIEVTYYYAVKDSELNIYYLEKDTDIELAKPEKQTGKVGEMYRTDAKEIEGYTLVENSGNTTGQLEVEPLTVIYYYLQNTRATVQYIDITTGEILDERTETGLVGDEFVTETKTFDDYILVQEPEQKTVNMTKDEIVLKYYYLHVSGGVIEQHIDVISGDVLYNGTHEGNEGDEYNIPSRTFNGYDLVEDRLPANSEGYMTVSPITVTYYYIHRAKVTAKYIDKTTGEKITPDVVENGHEDDPYTTENKVFEGYKLVQVPENSNGNMTKEDTVVTYYYVRETLGVVERHLDVLTNEALVAEKQYYGYAEDPYETHEQQIPGYDLVKERYPENATGKMGVEQIVVTYYYSKKTQVQVKYVDKITGQEIADTEVIDGHKGDNYTTESKEITGYDLVEVPTNKEGTMVDDITEVIYYYIRPAKVIANYYDIDTKETIAAEEVIDGHEGNEYETVEKEVKYYNLVEMPQNAKGNMTAEDTRVDYYYKKKDFNLKVEKQVKEIAYNGQVLSINGNIGKVELDKNKIASTEMVVTYEIKVTNTAELKGGAELIENIPSGMTMNELDNKDWVIHEDTAILSVEDLEPGQERSYNVVMRWTPSENNLGMKENIAEIVKVDNEAGFEEITIEDNKGKADLVISIKTGAEDDNTIVKLAILAIFAILGITVTVIIKKK